MKTVYVHNGKKVVEVDAPEQMTKINETIGDICERIHRNIRTSEHNSTEILELSKAVAKLADARTKM